MVSEEKNFLEKRLGAKEKLIKGNRVILGTPGPANVNRFHDSKWRFRKTFSKFIETGV